MEIDSETRKEIIKRINEWYAETDLPEGDWRRLLDKFNLNN